MSRHKRIARAERRDASSSFALSRLAHALARLLRAAHHAPAVQLKPVKVTEASDSYWRRYY